MTKEELGIESITFEHQGDDTYSWNIETNSGDEYEGIITFPRYERDATEIGWNYPVDLPEDWEDFEELIETECTNYISQQKGVVS